MKEQAIAPKNKVLKSLKKAVVYTEICPVRDVLDYIGDKWSMLIILQLGEMSPLRFGQVKNEVNGISQKMLTITLRQLEKDGFVERVYFPEVPPRVEYSITPLGESLLDVLKQLVNWAIANTQPILNARKKSMIK